METIYEDKSEKLKITIDRSYDSAFLEFARNITYGTNGMIYRMNSVEIEFKKFTHFVSLTEDDKLIGICLFKRKKLHQNNFIFDAFYRSFFSILPEKRNKGYATLLGSKTRDYLFAQFEKVIIYLYIEEENTRNIRVAQKTNYIQLTSFLLVSHICLRPKQNKCVTKLEQKEISKMQSLLNDQYVNHSFVDIDESFDVESYYVLKENDEIKAGLQVKVLSYTFEKFPGLYGFFLMKIIPKIPILKKVFNPKNHTFLKVGNIYANDQSNVGKLLDAVLHIYNLRTSAACLNPDSKVDAAIIGTMKKGMLSSVTSKQYMLYNVKNISLAELNVNAKDCFYSNF